MKLLHLTSLGASCVAIILLLLLNMLFKPQVVIFNQDRVLKQFVLQMSHHHFSEEQLQQKTMQFGQNLKVSLHEYAKKQHVVILNQQNTLAGGFDITDEVLALISDKATGLKNEK